MMIEQIVKQLLPFYPKVNSEYLRIEKNEYDDQCYEISEEGKEAPFLFIMLNHEGKLESFSANDGYFTGDHGLSKEEILKKATELVDMLALNMSEQLHLSVMIGSDERWWIEFVQKDPYLGIELPNSGVSVRIEKNGVIMGATIELQFFRIEEPYIMISAAEAKKLFLNHLTLMPAIMKFDNDYINGDDAYHLVYYVEDFVMGIGIDGELETIESLGINPAQYEALSPAKNTSKNLYGIIGIPKGFTKISDGQTDDGRLEVWSNQSVTESEFEEADVLEIYFDETNHVSLLSGIPDEYEKSQSNKSVEKALERAIEFLQCQYEDATECFRLLKEEHELLFYDEEREIELVDAYQFNFQRFERGVIVAGATISLEVDSRSLMITTVYTEAGIQQDLSAIAVNCIFPVEKAQEIYKNALEMETSWSKEFDENPITYKLNYLPAFPATNGHMRAIDAKTGQPWIIDTSYMESFES